MTIGTKMGVPGSQILKQKMQNSSFIKSKIKKSLFLKVHSSKLKETCIFIQDNDSIMTFGTFFIQGAIFVDFRLSICDLQRSKILGKNKKPQYQPKTEKVPKIIWDHYSCIKIHVSCSFELCTFKNQDIWFFL